MMMDGEGDSQTIIRATGRVDVIVEAEQTVPEPRSGDCLSD